MLKKNVQQPISNKSVNKPNQKERNHNMSTVKTIKSIKQEKIDTAITPAKIMQSARTWQPRLSKRGRKSILEEHIDTIRYLRSSRKMSYRVISEFFNSNGVKVSYANLIHFASKNKIGGSKLKAKQEVDTEL